MVGSTKRYAYRYDGSPLAAQRPLTKEEMLKIMNVHTTLQTQLFEVFELVPVKAVKTVVVSLERE